MAWPHETVKTPDPSDSSTTNIFISSSAIPTAAPASTIGGNQNPEADLAGYRIYCGFSVVSSNFSRSSP